MSFLTLALVAVTCALSGPAPANCIEYNSVPFSTQTATPAKQEAVSLTGQAVDVVLTANAAIVWDLKSGTILYEKDVDKTLPIASLNKLLSVIVVRDHLAPGQIVEIPTAARIAQSKGANIRLPVGEHASVTSLLEASLVPSANDAMVTLAHAVAGSEEEFVKITNQYAKQHGMASTLVANSTGLSGGIQHSTARNVRTMLTTVYQDPLVSPFLSQGKGQLTTTEGTTRKYVTTNKLLGTYLPIVAAKTGYTVEAKENLAIITENDQGKQIGAVILGSSDRFQDMKILVEWVFRNYTWR